MNIYGRPLEETLNKATMRSLGRPDVRLWAMLKDRLV